eukprot:1729587-Prymnesium_polylepis.1
MAIDELQRSAPHITVAQHDRASARSLQPHRRRAAHLVGRAAVGAALDQARARADVRVVRRQHRQPRRRRRRRRDRRPG